MIFFTWKSILNIMYQPKQLNNQLFQYYASEKSKTIKQEHFIIQFDLKCFTRISGNHIHDAYQHQCDVWLC